MRQNRPAWVQPEGTKPLSSVKRIPYDMREYDYCHRLCRTTSLPTGNHRNSPKHGVLDTEVVIETVHKSLASLTMEIAVSLRRVQRGEATHIEAGPL